MPLNKETKPKPKRISGCSIVNVPQILPYLTAYKTHGYRRRAPILAGQIQKKQSTNIKPDEINMMNIINDVIFIVFSSVF